MATQARDLSRDLKSSLIACVRRTRYSSKNAARFTSGLQRTRQPGKSIFGAVCCLVQSRAEVGQLLVALILSAKNEQEASSDPMTL